MNGEEFQIAMVDIGLGRTWDESRIQNKNAEKKKDWDDLVLDFKEAEQNEWSVSIPQD